MNFPEASCTDLILGQHRLNVDGHGIPLPKSGSQWWGGKQLFLFRFPKFNTTAFYDPTIELSPTTVELSSTSSPLVLDPTTELSSTPIELSPTSKPVVFDPTSDMMSPTSIFPLQSSTSKTNSASKCKIGFLSMVICLLSLLKLFMCWPSHWHAPFSR